MLFRSLSGSAEPLHYYYYYYYYMRAPWKGKVRTLRDSVKESVSRFLTPLETSDRVLSTLKCGTLSTRSRHLRPPPSPLRKPTEPTSRTLRRLETAHPHRSDDSDETRPKTLSTVGLPTSTPTPHPNPLRRLRRLSERFHHSDDPNHSPTHPVALRTRPTRLCPLSQ